MITIVRHVKLGEGFACVVTDSCTGNSYLQKYTIDSTCRTMMIEEHLFHSEIKSCRIFDSVYKGK